MATYLYNGVELPLVPHPDKKGRLAAFAVTRKGFPPVAVYETDAPPPVPKPLVVTRPAFTGTQSPAAPVSQPIPATKKGA